jgi:GT2 family glycosyltransferase
LLRHTRGCKLEVIVVDNASTDGSPEMVRADFSSVRLLANHRNVGFAAGCNQGLAQASSRHLLLLNSDTLLENDAVTELAAFLDAHPGVGLVGCALKNVDGSRQPSLGHFPSVAGALLAKLRQAGRRQAGPWRNFNYPFLSFEQHGQEQDVDWVAGAAMLTRRDVVEQVGPMDEKIFLFAEEWDWCYRMRAAGWRIRFTPAVHVVHVGSGSWAFSLSLLSQSRRAGIFYFYRKHYGRFSAAVFRLLVAAGAAVRTALAAIRCLFPSSRREEPGRQLREGWESLRWAVSPAASRMLRSEDLAAPAPTRSNDARGD